MNEFNQLKCNINLKRDIKSFYNIKMIFSFLDERQKLNMINYNKQLQDIFRISIHNYKKLSGRYKIGEKNGKGAEYTLNGNNLLFEGEYLNGKRNGKGKEYFNENKLKFEGEYLNGKRNGKGKEYYYNGNLKFEGEYLNGKKWNGKGYNKNGIFDFQIKDGNGRVKEYYNDDELKFEGEYLNGKRNGKGK